jgi:ethanolamine utilization protein EutA (predicted chaperonin)
VDTAAYCEAAVGVEAVVVAGSCAYQCEAALEVKAVATPAGDFVVDSDLDEAPLKIAVTKA